MASFKNPWFLLFLIPVIIFIFITFFHIPKKFRYSKNKVISHVAALTALILAVLMFSGISINYKKLNLTNEVVILVDISDSNKDTKKEKDVYVKKLLDENKKVAKVAIIEFATEAVVKSNFTDNFDEAYEKYKSRTEIDTSSTNIENALIAATNLFKHKDTGKIILLTDGIETDDSALSAINVLNEKGITLDVKYFKNNQNFTDVGITGVDFPKKTIKENMSYELKIKLESSMNTRVPLKIFDNNSETYSKYHTLQKGNNAITLNYTFRGVGLHNLKFEIDLLNEKIKKNNVFYTSIDIKAVDKILILERENEGNNINEILSVKYKTQLKNIKDAPKTLTELSKYDQVILANVSNADMPDGFIDILDKYVSKLGGGLFTVAGNKIVSGKTINNTYNKDDLNGTLYQEMLPIIAEEYVPPVAVFLVIDASGSMGAIGKSGLTLMREAANYSIEGLKALDPRDYVGVIAFAYKTTEVVLGLTPASQKDKISQALNKIDHKMDATVYASAIALAGLELKAMTNVNRKHIIFISDGEPGDNKSAYLSKVAENLEAGITISTISFTNKVAVLEEIANAGNGKNYTAIESADIATRIKEDLKQPTIREYTQETFTPNISTESQIFENITQSDIPELDGFYGVKLKKKAQNVLSGQWKQPIYATWEYGQGKVGSLMFDLNNEFSSKFIANEKGREIIENITASLMPIDSIEINPIEMQLSKQNYKHRLNIYTKLEEKEQLEVEVSLIDENLNSTNYLNIPVKDYKGNDIVEFELKEPSLYKITVNKYSKDKQIIQSNYLYKSFSYSDEYLFQNVNKDMKGALNNLANLANGKVVETPKDSYSSLSKYIHKKYDPKILLAVIIIIVFLIDIAVRKFKFRWLHEIISEKRKNEKSKS